MVKMDSEQKKVLIESFKNIFSGVFGLILCIAVYYDFITLYLSISFLAVGLILIVSGLLRKYHTKYESMGELKARIIFFSLLGVIFFILFYFKLFNLKPYYLGALVGAIWCWLFVGEKIYFYLTQR